MMAYASPDPPRLNPPAQTTRGVPSKSLYVSHFLSTWNTRGFEFGAVLFLATIYPGTLLPMSIYALVRAATAIILSHQVGRYIDTQDRLKVVRLSIIGQRIAVVVSCLGFLFLLLKVTPDSILNRLTFAVLTLLACVEKLCSIMNTVAVERDWVIVIADQDEAILQELNSQMRRIDLFCKLVAPLMIALLDGIATKIALLVTLVLNICSTAIEYPFIARVYQKTPALAQQEPISRMEHNNKQQIRTDLSIVGGIKVALEAILQALKSYAGSTAFLPSLALSMLYLTVLSFSGQMTTFLLAVPSPKITSTTIGLLRTASTIVEISATYIAPRVMATIGPVRAGIWCLSWQLMCLTMGVGTLWSDQASGSAIGIAIFIVAVILSRIGLWSFDLVAQLLIQNSIDAGRRGSFSSVEASLQNFFELCTFATTIVFSRPYQFKYPALISLVATCCAAALYAKFVRNRRGHLLHLPSCLKHVGERYEMVAVADSSE